MIDTSTEWRVLAKLCDSQFIWYVDLITAELFTNERKEIFEAIATSYREYGSVSPESLQTYLGYATPAQLDISVMAEMPPMVDRLHLMAVRRQLEEKSRALKALSTQKELDLDEIQRVLEFAPILSEEDTGLATGVQQFLAELHRKREGNYAFIPTGFPSLDQAFGGEWPTGLTLIGALPGTGKTALMMQSATKMALENGTGVGIFSMEMKKPRLIARAVANYTEIPLNSIKIGDVDDQQVKLIEEWSNRIAALPIQFVEKSGLNVHQIISYMRRMMAHGIRVFFIDHLQCISYEGENRNQALGQITRLLKAFADRHNLKVVLLCHLVKKDGGRYEVRDSGEPQGIAEVFFVMQADGKDDVVRVEFIPEKNRDGDTRPMSFLFNKPYQRFVDGLVRLPDEKRSTVAAAAD